MEDERVHNIPVTKILIDCVLVAAVGFPILFLFLWGEAFERGFFCNDESLMHPYHESTVPSFYLYIFGIAMPAIVIIITEIVNNNQKDKKVIFLGYDIPFCVWKIYTVLVVFAFGCCCSQLTTDIMKYTVGRLRPHFLTVCSPSVDCSLSENQHKYHTDFTCTNPKYINNTRILKELRLSFPSGHSSFSMFTMVFFAVYIQMKMSWNGSNLLRHTLQFLAISASVYTGMTRISDYKHHWSDVLGGLALGALIGLIIARYVSPLFNRKRFYKTVMDSELSTLNLNGHQPHHV